MKKVGRQTFTLVLDTLLRHFLRLHLFRRAQLLVQLHDSRSKQVLKFANFLLITPPQSIQSGTQKSELLLRYLIDQGHSDALALAAYRLQLDELEKANDERADSLRLREHRFRQFGAQAFRRLQPLILPDRAQEAFPVLIGRYAIPRRRPMVAQSPGFSKERIEEALGFGRA